MLGVWALILCHIHPCVPLPELQVSRQNLQDNLGQSCGLEENRLHRVVFKALGDCPDIEDREFKVTSTNTAFQQ